MRQAITTLALVLLIAFSAALADSGMNSVSSDNVNVRRGPGQNHEVFYQAPLGYPVKVERIQGDWLYCKDWEGDRGWIHRSLIGNTKTVIITGDDVNLRQGPGLQQPILQKTERGNIYKLLRSRSGWLQLGYYNDNETAGWVRGDLVWGN